MAEKESSDLRSILRNMVITKTSLIYLVSDEDRRVESEIRSLGLAFRPNVRVYVWSCTRGVVLEDATILASSSLLDALDWFMNLDEIAFLILNDAQFFLSDNPPVIRKIKDLFARVENTHKTIFMVAPSLVIPPELSSEIVVMDVPLPQPEDIERILSLLVEKEKHQETLKESLTPSLRDQFVKAGAGLSSQHIIQVFRKTISGKQNVSDREIDILYEEKRQLVKKSGLLELVPPGMLFDHLGGFRTFKQWLILRKDIFSKRAREYGLSFPKGVLLMGISGCGKSLCVKAIAAFWKIPLLRLDMGRLYDGIQGSPEECLRKVIKTSEASSPCVLWIDEIEAGIANAGQKSLGGSASRVLASFLTWMQEKNSPVFIGATANNIELLPPEILRKGRFDELFYVELPQAEERAEILRIHLARRNIPPERFEYASLVKITEGFNGAELEQGVLGALFRAFTADREVQHNDLVISLENIVPLSTTMKEQIRQLERWAFNRALKAGEA